MRVFSGISIKNPAENLLKSSVGLWRAHKYSLVYHQVVLLFQYKPKLELQANENGKEVNWLCIDSYHGCANLR